MSPLRWSLCQALYDLVERDVSVTIDDVMAELGCSYRDAKQAVRDVRLWLHESGCEFTLAATPQGARQRWAYTFEGTYDGARPWVTNRIADARSRLETMHAVCAPLVAASDGRTVEGRKARALEMGTRHLLEELEHLGTYGP